MAGGSHGILSQVAEVSKVPRKSGTDTEEKKNFTHLVPWPIFGTILVAPICLSSLPVTISVSRRIAPHCTCDVAVGQNYCPRLWMAQLRNGSTWLNAKFVRSIGTLFFATFPAIPYPFSRSGSAQCWMSPKVASTLWRCRKEGLLLPLPIRGLGLCTHHRWLEDPPAGWKRWDFSAEVTGCLGQPIEIVTDYGLLDRDRIKQHAGSIKRIIHT